jgi:hypothetical protein
MQQTAPYLARVPRKADSELEPTREVIFRRPDGTPMLKAEIDRLFNNAADSLTRSNSPGFYEFRPTVNPRHEFEPGEDTGTYYARMFPHAQSFNQSAEPDDDESDVRVLLAQGRL